jgi:alpha-mannosidase
MEVNERGQISRLWDKTSEREVLTAGGRSNVFQLFEDKPAEYDAWNIDANFEDKRWELDNLVSCEVVEEGPLRAGLRLEWEYGGQTRIVQQVYVYAHTPRIDFVTDIRWQERQTLLKVAFEANVHSREATADVQWGNVTRPTHRNTSWDSARFETCAHKWVDVSEGDYGVAILNDGKYELNYPLFTLPTPSDAVAVSSEGCKNRLKRWNLA